MDSLIKIIGHRIKIFRKNKGLSQEKLGELSNLHPNYIGQVERGEKNITLETISKISIGLNVQLELLFHYTDEKYNQENLTEIFCLLNTRTSEDQAMALNVLKTVFEWKENKT